MYGFPLPIHQLGTYLLQLVRNSCASSKSRSLTIGLSITFPLIVIHWIIFLKSGANKIATPLRVGGGTGCAGRQNKMFKHKSNHFFRINRVYAKTAGYSLYITYLPTLLSSYTYFRILLAGVWWSNSLVSYIIIEYVICYGCVIF